MKKNSETHIIMFPFQCSFCGSKEQPRTTTDSKNSDPEPLVSVISFYCSWDLLSVYKTRTDCKASMGRGESGRSFICSLHIGGSVLRQWMCSLQLHHVTFTASLASSICLWNFTSCKMQNSPPSKQQPLATNPLFWMNESKCNYAVCELYNLTTLFLCL